MGRPVSRPAGSRWRVFDAAAYLWVAVFVGYMTWELVRP